MHQRSNSENSFQILNKNNSFFLEEKVISNTNLTHKPMKHLKFDTTNIKFFVNESKALKFNHRHTKSLKSNASELDINNQNFPKLNKTFCDEEFKKYNQNFKSESESNLFFILFIFLLNLLNNSFSFYFFKIIFFFFQRIVDFEF